MRAVLDANVLFPTILREILTDLAAAGLYEAFWSDRILAEWQYAAARLAPEQEVLAGGEIAMLRLRFPMAVVSAEGQAAIDLDLPDPADRHVLEAAVAAKADLIVTANLRDFPQRLLAGLALQAVHPDAFLVDLWRRDAVHVEKALANAQQKAAASGGAMSMQQMMKRCRLPRLAKALKG